MADVNWAAYQQQPDLVSNFAKGFQAGSIINQNRIAQEQKSLALQQQQQLEERAKLLQDRLSSISSVTDPYARVESLNTIMTEFPEVADKLDKQASFYSDKVKANAVNELLPALNALNLGNKDVDIKRLKQTAEGMKNSGNSRGAQTIESYIADIEGADNTAGLVQTGYLTLAGILGTGKLADTLKSSQEYAKNQAIMPEDILQAKAKTVQEQEKATQAPIETQTKQAELQTKQIQAKFEETKQAQELEQRGWNIAKLKNDIDIAKQNSRIALINASLSKEGNDLKRKELEMKLQDAETKRNETLSQKTASIESARSSMDNMLNTAERIINTPKNVIQNATGPLSTRLPTMRQSTADFESLIENLSSQAFLAQIPNIKGMGALSNAEGEKLQQALQNFSLKQSPEQLIGNIKEAQRLIKKGRANLANQYGVPDSEPDIPALKGAIKRVK